MILGAVGYSVLVAISAIQAFGGRAPLDLTLGVALVLGMGAVFLVGAYATALIGLRANSVRAEGKRSA